MDKKIETVNSPAQRKPPLKLVFGIVTLLIFMLYSTTRWPFQLDANFQGKEDLCIQPLLDTKPSNYTKAYESPRFRLESANRLSGAIKIPTMSFDDMGPVGRDQRWAPFQDFHKYLRGTFPRVHHEANVTVIGGYSLLFELEGSVRDLKPLMLAAHQDVVPAISATEKWTHPPFSGAIDNDWIYGRGSSDCKNNLIGILTALEHLVKSDWKPRRTIILAFGQDEEISGPRGAYNIGKYIEKKYGRDGIAMIVDEGGMGLDTLYGTDFALPGVAEKGYSNFIVEVDMLGGHSSVPSIHTSIGILSKIVSNVEDSTVFHPYLEKSSPIWGYLQCIARHGKRSMVPPWIKHAVSSKTPNMKKAAELFAKLSPANRYLIQTSKAATIFNAGVKANALAERATVLFNSRIDLHSSPDRVKESYLGLIRPIAKKYSLLLNGEPFSSEPSIGNITVKQNDPSFSSPVAPFTVKSTGWRTFAGAVRASFGNHVVLAPSAMTGNTDTRHYWNLTRNIYRWSPARIGTRLNAHTVDEKIKIDTHIDGIRFYTELILQTDAVGRAL